MEFYVNIFSGCTVTREFCEIFGFYYIRGTTISDHQDVIQRIITGNETCVYVYDLEVYKGEVLDLCYLCK